MKKTGRNDPCPCGSGKKFKKCCILKIPVGCPEESSRQPFFFESELDSISNSVIQLIEESRFSEAEQVCNRLLAEYPDQVDGLERLGMTYLAQGKKREAASCYRKAAEFMATHEGFDDESIEDLLSEAERLESEVD